MACETCGHTLQGVGRTEDGRRHFWCPRCGTLVSESVDTVTAFGPVGDPGRDVEAPKLVGWSRRLFALLKSSGGWGGLSLEVRAAVAAVRESVGEGRTGE